DRMLVTFIFGIGSECHNSAAYPFLPPMASIFTSSGFQASCHPPRMNLTPNKRRFYQQGTRASTLMQSTL
ncbi:hypothetical protein, partial [Microcoleus sp. Pol12B4]|uniref:hypothetical protein n=1 Tax=Microcoleus sp. Pol12B4 TaxID=3055395 RepID=UPI002FD0E2DB